MLKILSIFLLFQLGRQLVYRSKPPSGNKHELPLVKDTRTKSLEEEYFFT